MIIEYVGLPGSGKTYLANKFCREHTEYSVVRNASRAVSLLFCFLFLLRHPIVTATVISLTVKETPKNFSLLRHKLFHLIFRVLANEGRAQFKKNAIVDEGIFQYMLSTYERKMDKEGISQDWDILCRSRFKREALFIEISHDTRVMRMQLRQHTPRMDFGKEYRKHFFSVLEHNYPIIKNVLKDWYIHETKINNEDCNEGHD